MTPNSGVDPFSSNIPFLGCPSIATEHGSRNAEWQGTLPGMESSDG